MLRGKKEETNRSVPGPHTWFPYVQEQDEKNRKRFVRRAIPFAFRRKNRRRGITHLAHLAQASDPPSLPPIHHLLRIPRTISEPLVSRKFRYASRNLSTALSHVDAIELSAVDGVGAEVVLDVTGALRGSGPVGE